MPGITIPKGKAPKNSKTSKEEKEDARTFQKYDIPPFSDLQLLEICKKLF